MMIQIDETNPMDAAEMRELLTHLGWTQKRMADEMGVSRSTFDRYMAADEFPKGWAGATFILTLKHKAPREMKESIAENSGFSECMKADFLE